MSRYVLPALAASEFGAINFAWLWLLLKHSIEIAPPPRLPRFPRLSPPGWASIFVVTSAAEIFRFGC